MEERGISYNHSTFDFDEIFKKIKDIKQNIELEIEKLNNSYDKIMIDITETYKRRHTLLDEEEHKVKLSLDKKVTEIKSELEIYLMESSDILLSCEKMKKANEYYKKNNNGNDNIIKTLYYISEINKGIENSKKFIIKPIMNSEISFNKFNYNISCFDYYFNGIPIPKDIKVNEKGEKLIISWNTNNFIVKYLDNNNIKYQIKIKVNFDESTYEISDTSISLDKYDYYAIYEVKIRALIDNYFGEWSEIKKFKIYELGDDKKENNNNFNLFNPFNLNENSKNKNDIILTEKNKNEKNPFFNKANENNINPFNFLNNLKDNENNINPFNLLNDNNNKGNENKSNDDKNIGFNPFINAAENFFGDNNKEKEQDRNNNNNKRNIFFFKNNNNK